MFARIVPPALALALLPGCSGESHGPRVRTGDPDEEVKTATGLSEDECRQLADQFVSAAQKQEAAGLASFFDWDALLHTAASDIEAPIQEHKRFAARMKGNDKKIGALGGQIVDLVARG